MTIDWLILKKPLIALMLVFITSLLGVGYLWFSYHKSYNNYYDISIRVEEARNRYKNSALDMALLEKYQDDFLAYKAAGIIGEENRLSWIEVLRQQKQRLHLTNFNVNIARREKVNIDFSPRVQGYISRQNIRTDLMHEGDFYSLLEALKNKADGLFRVASCRLIRAQEIKIVRQAKNINVECELEWFSLEVLP